MSIDQQSNQQQNKEIIPRHLAIIMDGNRRWAAKKKLPVFFGHRAGVKTLKKILKFSSEKKIEYLTCFAFSTENWNRSKEETHFLIRLLETSIEEEFEELLKSQVRVQFLGELEILEQSLREKIRQLEKKTENCKKIRLQIAVNYGARQDILRASQAYLANNNSNNSLIKNPDNNLGADRSNLELEFSKHLQTKDLPELDLLVRTGGEFRVSNFLLWELAYTELFFSEKMWPDFSESDLLLALEEFSSRKRRFGA